MMALPCSRKVKEIYFGVVLDVIDGVREAFLDEGLDEQVLQELKRLWGSKLIASKAFDTVPERKHADSSALVRKPKPTQQLVEEPTPLPPDQQIEQMPEVPITASYQLPQQQLITQPQMLQYGQMVVVPQHFGIPQHNLIPATPSQMAQFALPAGCYQLQLTQQQLNQLNVVPQPQFTVVAPGTQQKIRPRSKAKAKRPLVQLDGCGDSSSDEDVDEEDDDDDVDDDDDAEDEDEEAEKEEEDPLNSGDDQSDCEDAEAFNADHFIFCLFEKVKNRKSIWKIRLTEGMMNLNGKDLVFNKAFGDTSWFERP